MAVWVRQENDGVQTGEAAPVEQDYKGQPDIVLLDAKLADHREQGWATEDTDVGFHAWKFSDDPLRPVMVDRYFEIR